MGAKADICIVAEGSYPFVSGGVSQWTHQLIEEHAERTFHILTLVPPHAELTMYYTLPKNVIGHTVYMLQELPKGKSASHTPSKAWEILHNQFLGLITSPTYDNFQSIFDLFKEYREVLGKEILCESQQAWDFVIEVYETANPTGPFKDAFSTIHVLSRSLFSVILPRLPEAKVYHALCTGYAGFIAYRAKIEQGIPFLVTEQGIYTNERRIEIAMADWISDMTSLNLALEDRKRGLKDFWLNAFLSMAHVCYQEASEVISTFDGNQEIQLEGGCDPKKMYAIAHGIQSEEYDQIKWQPNERPLKIAFIGRIVPIKDVATFIRAAKIVTDCLEDVEILAIGPQEEDPEYAEECYRLMLFLGLHNRFTFTGRMNIRDILPEIDLLVLTSISEAQPIVILEAGYLGIPCVATNVGACYQLCHGSEHEDPPLGQSGIVTPLSDPPATAEAIIKMVTDPSFYKSCSDVMKKRIRTYYRFEQQHEKYREFYARHIDKTLEGQA